MSDKTTAYRGFYCHVCRDEKPKQEIERLRQALRSIVDQATYIRQLPISDSYRDGLQQGWSAARTIAMEALNVRP